MSDLQWDATSNRIHQLSVFLPNRLGALLHLQRTLEAADIRIRALTILDAADHAVVRLIVDQPTLGEEILKSDGHAPVVSELLGVALPRGHNVRGVLRALIAAELNIHYLYSFLEPVRGEAALALSVEASDQAARQLLDRGFRLLHQDDLRDRDDEGD